MADSSPSLQNHAAFLADSTNIRSDAHSDNHLSSQREASARLASEFFSSTMGKNGTKAESVADTTGGVARAASVLAGGMKDGVIESAKHSLNLQTAQTVAESVGIGYGLGALAKAGPVGQKLAMAGGMVMGASWLYSEFERGRPQATINAVADAYSHKENVAADRKIVAANGGALAFETGLAFAAGGIGMKKGLELKTNWHTDAIASGKSAFNSSVEFLNHDGRVNGLHVLGDNKMGTAFAGKDATPLSAVEQAKKIISGKSEGSGNLASIQETFARTQMQRNDAQLLDTRSKLVDLEGQHARVRGEETALAPRLNKAVKEKSEIEDLGRHETTIKNRQQALADAQAISRELPAKKKALDALYDEKQAAFARQTGDKGAPVDPALREDFQAKHKAFQAEKARYEDMKTDGGSEALTRHRESLQEAQDALVRAKAEQPARLAAAGAEIDGINAQMAELKTQRTDLEAQIKQHVDSYTARLDLLMKDPSKLEQAQFEPPAAKPAARPEAAPTVSAVVEAPKPVFEAPKPVVEAPKPAVEAAPAVVEAPKPAPVAVSEVASLHAEKPVAAREARVETAAEAPVEKALDAGVSRLSPDAQQSRSNAMKAIRGNELSREKDYCTKVLSEIEQNIYRPTNRASIPEVKADMERRLAEVNDKLKTEEGVKYTRALKSVLQYGRSAAKQLADTPDMRVRDGITEQALTDIEGMMGRLPTSYKGYQGKLPDLAEPSRLGRNGSPEKRFADVLDHLEGKVKLLDGSRARQVADMAERQPVLRDIVHQLDNGTLPSDGSIVLMGRDGKYLGPQGSSSPYFIEVQRLLDSGVGADGGGFNRFEAIQNDIAGAVVLRPLYENGVKVPLPGRYTNGQPVYKKAVEFTIGDVPEGIKPQLNFVDILRKFAPPRTAK